MLDGSVGLLLSMVNAYSVFLKFAKLWELQRTVTAAREREAAHGGLTRMFSLHIDTARTWRGGQSQVMYTVLGLRLLDQRAALVAHPEGALFKRMSEGLDLVPLAPKHEIDLAAAWRLSRVIRQLRPDVVQAHDPHAVAMAATALSISSPKPRPPLVASRRVEFRIAHNSFSRWKYSQVDCFIANSEAIRNRLVADGIPRDEDDGRQRGRGRRAHRQDAGGQRARRALSADARARRRQRRRARAAQGPAAPHRRRGASW